MKHIQETSEVYPFLYYQRVFIKGYIALNLPLVMAVTSDVGNGYVYIRRHMNGLRIRDLNNGFVRDAQSAAAVVRANPLRGVQIDQTVSVDLTVKGRDGSFTWMYTKDDVPRIVNSETHTEFLACMPLKTREVPNFNLVTTYLSSFIDWYRMVTGDISMTGPDHWNSHLPVYSECLVDIRAHRGRLIDELVVDVNPRGFAPRIYFTSTLSRMRPDR